jgi:hypothetical protein
MVRRRTLLGVDRTYALAYATLSDSTLTESSVTTDAAGR